MDEEGHFHITDFNIAAVLEDTHLATSMSGTKPYIAPEIFDCAVDLCVGYAYPVDWWSLGNSNTIFIIKWSLFNGSQYTQGWLHMKC